MSSASYVPDSQIETSPELEDKSVLRYGVDGPGWIVSPSEDPKVTVTLTDRVTGEAPYVKKIIISPHDNVEKVKCTMTKKLDNGNDIQIEDTVVLDDSGEINLDQAVKLSEVNLKMNKFTDDSTDIEVKIGVFACFVAHGRYLFASWFLYVQYILLKKHVP